VDFYGPVVQRNIMTFHPDCCHNCRQGKTRGTSTMSGMPHRRLGHGRRGPSSRACEEPIRCLPLLARLRLLRLCLRAPVVLAFCTFSVTSPSMGLGDNATPAMRDICRQCGNHLRVQVRDNLEQRGNRLAPGKQLLAVERIVSAARSFVYFP
jgi:hypothetical protein